MSDCPPKVSIVIVTHNSLPAFKDCLRALRVATEETAFELVVVDNASTDDSLSEVTQCFPEAVLLRNECNRGFAAACNQGAQAASGKYLLFLNPDVCVDPGSIECLLAAGSGQEGTGLVSGRLRNPDGSFQPTCRNFPGLFNLLVSRGSILRKLLGEWIDRRSIYTLPDFTATTAVPAVAATMVMIERDLFHSTGGFDSRYFLYMEDTDLSLRLHQASRVNLLVPTAGGVHHWGEGSGIGRFRRTWHHHRSLWQYFRKHHSAIASLLVLPPLLTVHLLLAWLFTLVRVKN